MLKQILTIKKAKEKATERIKNKQRFKLSIRYSYRNEFNTKSKGV